MTGNVHDKGDDLVRRRPSPSYSKVLSVLRREEEEGRTRSPVWPRDLTGMVSGTLLN